MQTSTRTISEKAVISVSGRFDFSAHREFRNACGAALRSNDVSEIEVDFGNVEYLDSSALGMLLMLKEQATAARKGVALSNCRGTVKRVLDIANFAKLFAIR